MSRRYGLGTLLASPLKKTALGRGRRGFYDSFSLPSVHSIGMASGHQRGEVLGRRRRRRIFLVFPRPGCKANPEWREIVLCAFFWRQTSSPPWGEGVVHEWALRHLLQRRKKKRKNCSWKRRRRRRGKGQMEKLAGD